MVYVVPWPSTNQANGQQLLPRRARCAGCKHHRGNNETAAATAASPANNRTCRHACYQAAWTAAPLHAATKVIHVCSFTCKNECSLHSVLAKKEQPQHTTESLVPISGTDNWALSGCRTRSHTLRHLQYTAHNPLTCAQHALGVTNLSTCAGLHPAQPCA